MPVVRASSTGADRLVRRHSARGPPDRGQCAGSARAGRATGSGVLPALYAGADFRDRSAGNAVRRRLPVPLVGLSNFARTLEAACHRVDGIARVERIEPGDGDRQQRRISAAELHRAGNTGARRGAGERAAADCDRSRHPDRTGILRPRSCGSPARAAWAGGCLSGE